jgi:tyrosine-protein kinase Etk/Wzc
MTRETSEPQEGLMPYVVVVWRYRAFIALLIVMALVATFVITTLMPKYFLSTAALVAPKESVHGALLGGLGGLASSGAAPPVSSLPSLSPNRDLLVSVLRSRTVAEGVVTQFGLQQRYRARYLEDAIRTLQGLTNVGVSKEGVISIRVEDTDPRMAADIANYHVDLLDKIVSQYGSSEAGRQRAFLTEQLARAKVALDESEDALRRFQERNRAVVLQDQTRGAIDAAARLRGEIMASEVQLQVMRNFATDVNPEVVALRRRIDEMNRQLSQMQYGERLTAPGSRNRDRTDFGVPFAKVPELGLDLARLAREVKAQETLVTLLVQQVEQARIAEAKDVPIVQRLDAAVPAERHSRPRMGLHLGVAAAVSLAFGVLAAFGREYARSLAPNRRFGRATDSA